MNSNQPKSFQELLIDAHSRIEETVRESSLFRQTLDHQRFLLEQREAGLLQIMKEIEDAGPDGDMHVCNVCRKTF